MSNYPNLNLQQNSSNAVPLYGSNQDPWFVQNSTVNVGAPKLSSNITLTNALSEQTPAFSENVNYQNFDAATKELSKALN